MVAKAKLDRGHSHKLRQCRRTQDPSNMTMASPRLALATMFTIYITLLGRHTSANSTKYTMECPTAAAMFVSFDGPGCQAESHVMEVTIPSASLAVSRRPNGAS